MKKLFLIQLVFIILNTTIQAQTHYQSIILNIEDNTALPYCSIGINNSSFGTVSNTQGLFILNQSEVYPYDTVLISHISYDTKKLAISDLTDTIFLTPMHIELSEVVVRDRDLTADEIMKKVKDNFDVNHPRTSCKRNIYYHYYNYVPGDSNNSIVCKKSDFDMLRPSLLDSITTLSYEDQRNYRDYIVDYYSFNDHYKTIPVKGYSLYEPKSEIEQEVMSKIAFLNEEIESSEKNDNYYYHLRTGIIGLSLSNEQDIQDSVKQKKEQTEHRLPNDSIYSYLTHYSGALHNFIESNSHINSSNLKYLKNQSLYNYEIEQVSIFNEDAIYIINCYPKKGSILESKLFISATDYGIYQIEYKLPDKMKDIEVKILGIKSSTNERKGIIKFEKSDSLYKLKYINTIVSETYGVDRNFIITKKKKVRFWPDKTINKIKIGINYTIKNIKNQEILILNEEPISEDTFDQLESPKKFPIAKKVVYDKQLYHSNSIIAPAELKKFQ